MLTRENNDHLTQVGPGTRMGNLLRRYWHIIGVVSEMSDRWTQRVRLLGEDLVLFKDRQGRFGLIAEACPHRRASMFRGIPTEQGIRCPYHGWMYDRQGHCLERPNENAPEALRDTVIATTYPVQELGGMLFAYLGPQPAPLLPNYDGYVVKPAIRMVGRAMVPCNWLQVMENSADPVHTEWLHGKLFEFVREKDNWKIPISNHHVKIGFDETEYGLTKRRLMEGQPEDCEDWTVGHPLVFPNILAVGSGGGLWKHHALQTRVPVDDTHTLHYWYDAYLPPSGVDVPQSLYDRIPVYDPPLKDENGEFRIDYVDAQDVWVWASQGPIHDRTQELLGSTDRGVVMYRQMLFREMEKVEAGLDPLGVIRDPARNKVINLPTEKGKDMFSDGLRKYIYRNITQFSPIAEELLTVFEKPRSTATKADAVPAE